MFNAAERTGERNESSFYETMTSAMEEGIIEALIEAEDKGITTLIKDGSPEHTWWLADIPRSDLKHVATLLWRAGCRSVEARNGSKEDHPDCEIRLVEQCVSSSELFADHLAVSTARLRAFVFASWVRARAERHAENYLRADISTLTKTVPPYLMRV